MLLRGRAVNALDFLPLFRTIEGSNLSWGHCIFLLFFYYPKTILITYYACLSIFNHLWRTRLIFNLNAPAYKSESRLVELTDFHNFGAKIVTIIPFTKQVYIYQFFHSFSAKIVTIIPIMEQLYNKVFIILAQK